MSRPGKALPPQLGTDYAKLLEQVRQVGNTLFEVGLIVDALATYSAGHALPLANELAPAALARLLIDYGRAASWHASLMGGDYREALRIFERSLELARTVGNAQLEGEAMLERAAAHYREALSMGGHDFDAVEQDISRAYELASGAGDSAGSHRAEFYLGLVEERRGNFEDAEVRLRRVYDDAASAGWPDQRAEAARHLGFAKMRGGEGHAAVALFEEALTLTARTQSQLFLPFALLSLGEAQQAVGNTTDARRLFEEAAGIADELGVLRAAAQVRFSLGDMAETDGDKIRARGEYETALAHARTIGFVPGIEVIEGALARLG